jgi:hypothetical protein
VLFAAVLLNPSPTEPDHNPTVWETKFTTVFQKAPPRHVKKLACLLVNSAYVVVKGEHGNGHNNKLRENWIPRIHSPASSKQHLAPQIWVRHEDTGFPPLRPFDNDEWPFGSAGEYACSSPCTRHDSRKCFWGVTKTPCGSRSILCCWISGATLLGRCDKRSGAPPRRPSGLRWHLGLSAALAQPIIPPSKERRSQSYLQPGQQGTGSNNGLQFVLCHPCPLQLEHPQ